MEECSEFISSGILELYVLGETTPAENARVEAMSARFPEIKKEILGISLVFEGIALENAVEPDPVTKPFLLATIDYMDRVRSGEIISAPPVLSASSLIADYRPWTERPDMVLPEDFEDVHARILSYTPEVLTAIVWIREMAPREIHDTEYEKFLVLEGTCNIVVEEQHHELKKGDYFTIPLHKPHLVLVTSDIPCKVILQRVAA